MALAGAILASYGCRNTLGILELNGAGGLNPVLERGTDHRCLRYPDIDLMRLDLSDGDCDLVVHSDTLEHVADPVTALGECRRVLRPGGLCIFTVPVIVGRLSRSRDGQAPSYHGDRQSRSPDLLVRSEFGADVWTYVLRAGFSSCAFHAVEFPAGLALAARR
jgi:SAM-dependent methyltransferase